MPMALMNSQLCPKGMEATMFALLAGCHNLGTTIAGNCGAYLLDWLGVSPSGTGNESHQFEDLWKASAISSVIRLIPIPFLFLMIPSTRQSERMLDEKQTEATTGSIWQQCVSSHVAD